MASSSATPLAQYAPSPDSKPDLTSIAKLLASDSIKNVVVLCGAGISTTAKRVRADGSLDDTGIPDFRSPDTGLYANLQKYDLPYPEAIFEIGFFQSNPQPFFTLAQSLYPGQFLPTPTHYFLSLLHDRGKLLRVFTQNIDTLERRAGVPDEKIVEAHGSFASASCVRCGGKADPEWMRAMCMRGEVARCRKVRVRRSSSNASNNSSQGGNELCNALVKPNITFFGEGLPDLFHARIGDLRRADLLIVLGTSLQVQPFASLIDRVPPTCPRVLLNLERVGDIGSEEDSGHGPSWMSSRFRESGFDFDGLGLGKGKKKSLVRDVFWKGKTDEGCRRVARECGWEGELDALLREGTERGIEEAKRVMKGDEGKREAEVGSDAAAAGAKGTEGQAKTAAAKVAAETEGEEKKAGESKEAEESSSPRPPAPSLRDESALAESKGRVDEDKSEANDLADEMAKKLAVKEGEGETEGEDTKKSSL